MLLPTTLPTGIGAFYNASDASSYYDYFISCCKITAILMKILPVDPEK
jgi:hypothetical protein